MRTSTDDGSRLAPVGPHLPKHEIAGLAGTSFKHQHLQAILADDACGGFFEIHAENYMGAGGPPHAALARIRQDFPVSLHGVCMSIGWQFQEAPPTFSALSLAIGVAAVRALKRFGAEDVGLKWPNDLIWRGRKLGGILIEMRGESGGPAAVVIGIGINMRMPASTRLALAEQQAALIADVHEILRERTPPRNELAGALTEEVVAMLQVFRSQGFEPFADEWRGLDALANAPVKVINGSESILGTARGVDADGALLIDVNGELRRFVSGEVSLRAAK